MKYSINFRLRPQPTQKAKQAIYVRLKIDGVTATDFATSILINPSQFVNQTIRGNTDLDFTNRAMMLKTESDLIELIRTNQTKTAKQIRDLFCGKVNTPATLLNTYQKFIREKKECFDGTPLELSKNTLGRWYNCKLHLEEFMKGQDIELLSVDIDFGNRLYLYLIKKTQKKDKTKKIGHDYAVRNLTYLNNVLDFAKRKGLILANVLDIEGYTRNPPKDVESLTSEQLTTLASMRFTGTLEDARIVFLMIAYCGINHCDLHKLESLKDTDVIILKINRQKNDKKVVEKAIIPILPELRELLERYNYKIPNHDINVINRHLHTFEGLLKVSINITTYTARKTAAMLLFERGVSIDTISKILGHSNTITTQRHYVKVSEKRVIEDTKHLHLR